MAGDKDSKATSGAAWERNQLAGKSGSHHLTRKCAENRIGRGEENHTYCAQMLSGPFPLLTSILGERLPL